MQTELSPNPSAVSRLYREVGLAVVAAELSLRGDMFEPELAEALDRGAAALIFAGYNRRRPRRTPSRATAPRMHRVNKVAAEQ
jgi:hypothetical protein